MMEHYLYLVTFSLPDGKHLMIQNSHPSVARQHAIDKLSLNEDAKLISIERLRDQAHHEEAKAALLAEDPHRIGAEELGLDTPNRILNDPQIARDVAAQRLQAGTPAPAEPSGGFGCC